MDTKKLLANELRNFADKLDSDECNLSPTEQAALLANISHTELNKTEAAELLNMSTRTFDRKIQAGEIPAGQHKRGSNALIWYKDEILDLID